MNPIILRGIRERLRIKHLIAAGLFPDCFRNHLFHRLPQRSQRWLELQSANRSNGTKRSLSGQRSPSRLPFSFVPARVLSHVSRYRPGCRHHRRGEGVRTLGLPTHDPYESILQNMGISFGFARQRILHVRSDPTLSPSLHHSRGTYLENVLHLYFVFFSSIVLYHLTAPPSVWSYPNRGPLPGFPHRRAGTSLPFFPPSAKQASLFSPS